MCLRREDSAASSEQIKREYETRPVLLCYNVSILIYYRASVVTIITTSSQGMQPTSSCEDRAGIINTVFSDDADTPLYL